MRTIGLDEEKILKYERWQEKHEKQVEIVQGSYSIKSKRKSAPSRRIIPKPPP